MTTKPRGGSRQGSGAPRLVPGQTTESVQVRLDPARKAKALAIGGGSVAKGVRAAIDAYPTPPEKLANAARIEFEAAQYRRLCAFPVSVLAKSDDMRHPGKVDVQELSIIAEAQYKAAKKDVETTRLAWISAVEYLRNRGLPPK